MVSAVMIVPKKVLAAATFAGGAFELVGWRGVLACVRLGTVPRARAIPLRRECQMGEEL